MNSSTKFSPTKTVDSLNSRLQEVFANPIEGSVHRKRSALSPQASIKDSSLDSIESFVRQELGELAEIPMDSEELTENVSLILIDCARRGSIERCQELLLKGYMSAKPNLDQRIIGGKTAFHVAIESGHYKVCEVLIEYGLYFSLDIPDDDMSTPLHYACQYNKENIARLFIRNGANINVQDCRGNTPIHYASINDNSELFHLLLAKDADITVVNDDGQNPLEAACGTRLAEELCLINIVHPSFKIPRKQLGDISFDEFVDPADII